MEEIRIHVTLTPHYQKGKPSGYYLLAQRLFPRGAPILVKQQFAGFSDGLIVTVNHPAHLDTVLKMAVTYPCLTNSVTWLSKTAIIPMSMGFRMYIPGTILLPPQGEKRNFETTGVFHGMGEMYWLHVPAVSGDILLGRRRLIDG